MKPFSFENLEVYQQARLMVRDIYAITEQFPDHEQFGLTSQIRRAMVSVVSNLAEGSGRISIKEKIHFIEIAYGSAMESYCQLQIATDLNYITPDDLDKLKPDFYVMTRKLNALRHSFESKLTQ